MASSVLKLQKKFKKIINRKNINFLTLFKLNIEKKIEVERIKEPKPVNK